MVAFYLQLWLSEQFVDLVCRGAGDPDLVLVDLGHDGGEDGGGGALGLVRHLVSTLKPRFIFVTINFSGI